MAVIDRLGPSIVYCTVPSSTASIADSTSVSASGQALRVVASGSNVIESSVEVLSVGQHHDRAAGGQGESIVGQLQAGV